MASAIQAIRKRPGMYIGDVDDGSGFHHLLVEVVNNALVEAWAGHCKNIQINLNEDGSATVRDDGRGIPTRSWQGQPVPVLVMTELHCGGLFESTTEKPEELNGVGVVVVNALSERLELRIWHDAKEHHIGFRFGIVEAPFTIVGSTPHHGTEITFLPDPGIFSSLQFDFDKIEQRIRSLAHLDFGVTLSIFDSRPTAPRAITLQI